MASKILVTGTNSGFGKLIVKSLRLKGHAVAASMRAAGQRNAAAAAELKSVGAHVVEMDVTSDASVLKAVAEAEKLLGGIDVVVNNAGVGVLGLQEAFTPEDWQKVFDINVFGVQRVNRAVLPAMRARRSGVLIHISSLLGRMVIPFYGPYNATKFALEALADNYRVELSAFGIESVLVEPGGYGTEFAQRLIRASDSARSAQYGPMSQAPDEALKAFEKNFTGPNAPNPQWVADAVVGLVETPRGKRPFRTVVDRLGMGQAIEPYNQAIDKIQAGIFNAFGMGQMLELKN